MKGNLKWGIGYFLGYNHINICPSINKRRTINYHPSNYGPCKVLQRIGSMAYKMELPPSSLIHSVFYVSYLRKVIGDKIPVQIILLEINEEGKIILEPKTII
jgi:hypothetical protein